MPSPHSAVARAALAAGLAVTACDGSTTPAPTPPDAAPPASPAATQTPPGDSGTRSSNAVAAIRVEPQRLVLGVGSRTRAGVLPVDEQGTPSLALLAGEPAWSVADRAVATVDGSGVVTGVAPGTTRLYARVGALLDSATVTVVADTTGQTAPPSAPPRQAGLAIFPAQLGVAVGRTAYVAAVLFDAAGRPVPTAGAQPTWRVADEGVARASAVQGAGDTTFVATVTGVAVGTTTLSVTLGGATATAAVTVLPPRADSTPTAPPPPVASFALTATVFAPAARPAGTRDTALSAPAAGARVTVYRLVRDGSAAPGDTLGTPTQVATATTDAAGQAVFRDLPSATYRVVAEPPAGAALREARAEIFPPRTADVRVALFLAPRP